MVSTRSGNTPRPRGNLGARFPTADPTTPTVDTAEEVIDPSIPDDANGPYNADSIGALMVGAPGIGTVNRHTEVIEKIIHLCGFPSDSTMVRFIDQQGWTDLEHATLVDFDEVKDFSTLRSDGKFEAKPMMIHLRSFKAFLLFYKRKGRMLQYTLTDDDVLDISKAEFKSYCGSLDYDEDFAAMSSPVVTKATPRVAGNANAVVLATDSVTVQEFRKGVKRDKTHYSDLKDDKFFSSWNRGFVATAYMHHTNNVLDETYVPTTDIDVAVFKEMQTFMYAVLEEHLKTDKGKSLVSQFELARDAQSIYRELKKHALSSTAAQLSGDTLLQYITTTRFPGNWRGTAYAFVLHWKEQVMKYETLEIEEFPPKQKLRMLQNAVGDVTELSYVKQIGDQDIARGNPPLAYEGYMELLLSACSTYDKKIELPGKQKLAVYNASLYHDNDGNPFDVSLNGEYEVFNVDTDVSDILAHNTNSYRGGDRKSSGKSNFLPREAWNKLSQDQKDKMIEKRRQEQMESSLQANTHEVNDFVNLDEIIAYAAMKHDSIVDGDKDIKVDKPNDCALLAYMAGRDVEQSPGDIRRVLASSLAPSNRQTLKANKSNASPSTFQVGDMTYYLNKGETINYQGQSYSAHMACVPYCVHHADDVFIDKALIDRGANVGICGDDMAVIAFSDRYVDIFGLAGHTVRKLQIVTAQALISTHIGDVIATFHHMAFLGTGKSILSCLQMEAYGADINDRPCSLPGGKQTILIHGYEIPLDFRDGLPYLGCRIPSEEETSLLTHINMTANDEWNPSLYDNHIESLDVNQFEMIDVADCNLDGEITFFKDGFNPFDDILVEEYEFFEDDAGLPSTLDSYSKTFRVPYHWVIRLYPFGGEYIFIFLGYTHIHGDKHFRHPEFTVYEADCVKLLNADIPNVKRFIMIYLFSYGEQYQAHAYSNCLWKFEAKIKCENGETSNFPSDLDSADNNGTHVEDRIKSDVLDKPGWKYCNQTLNVCHKHLIHQQLWQKLQTILFYSGNEDGIFEIDHGD